MAGGADARRLRMPHWASALLLLAAGVGLVSYWIAAENDVGVPAQQGAGYAAAAAVGGGIVFLARWVSEARSDLVKALGAVLIAFVGLVALATLWILSQN